MSANEKILAANLGLIDTCLKYQTKGFKNYVDDLKQELCLQILEMDIFKLNKIVDEGHLNAYITKIIWNSLHSKTSPFFRTYIQPLRDSRCIENYDFVDEET